MVEVFRPMPRLSGEFADKPLSPKDLRLWYIVRNMGGKKRQISFRNEWFRSLASSFSSNSAFEAEGYSC